MRHEEEDDAHVIQMHFHVGLLTIPVGFEAEDVDVEVNYLLIVCCEEPNGVKSECIHCSLCQFCIINDDNADDP